MFCAFYKYVIPVKTQITVECKDGVVADITD